MEFLLCFVLGAMAVLGTLDMAIAMHDLSTLEYAVTEGARCTAQHMAACPDPVAYTASLTNGLGFINSSALQVQVVPTATTVTITATYTFHPVGPVFPSITLVRAATAAVGG